MSEQGWSKVEQENVRNVRNVRARSRQGGMGKCQKHWRKVGVEIWYMKVTCFISVLLKC